MPRRLSDQGRRRTGSRPSCPASTRARTSTRSTPTSRSSIENIRNTALPPTEQRRQLDLLRAAQRSSTSAARADDAALEARIQSFELAYRMQIEAAEAFDVSREPQHIRDLYGDGVHGPADC